MSHADQVISFVQSIQNKYINLNPVTNINTCVYLISFEELGYLNLWAMPKLWLINLGFSNTIGDRFFGFLIGKKERWYLN